MFRIKFEAKPEEVQAIKDTSAKALHAVASMFKKGYIATRDSIHNATAPKADA